MGYGWLLGYGKPDGGPVFSVSAVSDDVEFWCPYLKLPFPVHDG